MQRAERQEDLRGQGSPGPKEDLSRAPWDEAPGIWALLQCCLPACVIIYKDDPLWALCNERTVAKTVGNCEAHIDWWVSSEAHVSHSSILTGLPRYM